jgi:hypothetical protein
VSTFTMGGGVFIGVNGTSTDLERSVCHQVVAGRLGGAASTDSGFSSSCRHVETKARVELPQTLAGRLAPGPTRPRVWATWSTCQMHPVVMMILIFGQLRFVIP